MSNLKAVHILKQNPTNIQFTPVTFKKNLSHAVSRKKNHLCFITPEKLYLRYR